MIAEGKSKARYIMIGGFLGAGKTTAVSRLARHLVDRGVRVGLISNDQSTGLVDTAVLRSQGFHVEEITGGCFCCRFNSLLEAANELTASARPDVFIAEPVGSCTDLVATVSYPLRRIYGDRFITAPLSVLMDPIRGARIFGLSSGRTFSPKVVYVYRKQLEEADLIVINKCDLIAEPLRKQLEEVLRESCPRADVLSCSARQGTGLEDWFARLMSVESGTAPTMSIDYDKYAEGEALLGWLNCTVRLSANDPFDANELLLDLACALRDGIAKKASEIAHLKMTLDAVGNAGTLSVVSIVGSESTPDLRESLLDRVDAGELIINLRAEADPEMLRAVVLEMLDRCVRVDRGVSVELEHIEHFRPSRPVPTHRITVAE